MAPISMGAITVAALSKIPASVPATADKSQIPSAAASTKATVPYGVSDGFDEMDAPLVKTRADMVYSDPASHEQRVAERAALPPLYDGDEFAIDELEHAPGYAAAPGTTAFAGTDADLSAIIPTLGDNDDSEEFSSVELPDNIKSILAHSAQQMNEGLRGRTDRK